MFAHIQPASSPARVKDEVKQPASQPAVAAHEEDEVKPPASQPANANGANSPVKVKINSIKEASMPAAKWSMTKRFTVAEKLRIIDKFNEEKNVSATCR